MANDMTKSPDEFGRSAQLPAAQYGAAGGKAAGQVLDTGCYAPALQLVRTLLQSAGGKGVIIAIDGRCGSGKTTLAGLLNEQFACNIFHMDDFYLPFAARRAGWEKTPGANMDFSRLIREVLAPARKGQGGEYSVYDCHSDTARRMLFAPQPLTVVEGSYSHAPQLAGYYDAAIFLTCSPQVQQARLEQREGAHWESFRTRWIPLEEGYFAQYGVMEKSSLVIDTGC